MRAENNVSIGRTRAGVTAASAISLIVTVPAAAGSGKVTVVTPGGSATSSGEFLAVPERFTAANVGTTSVLTVDRSPSAVTLGTAGKIAVLRFAGVGSRQKVDRAVARQLCGHRHKAAAGSWAWKPYRRAGDDIGERG